MAIDYAPYYVFLFRKARKALPDLGSAFQTVKKASQSSLRQQRKESESR